MSTFNFDTSRKEKVSSANNVTEVFSKEGGIKRGLVKISKIRPKSTKSLKNVNVNWGGRIEKLNNKILSLGKI